MKGRSEDNASITGVNPAVQSGGVFPGVVTLTREVNLQYKRDLAEKVTMREPNVKQDVNDL